MNLDRTAHPSAKQVETLLSFLERNPRLSKGFPRHLSSKQAAKQEWSRVIAKLNNMPGTVKSAQKWFKYWSDKKSAVKKKNAARIAYNETGKGEEPPELSDVEERILALMTAKNVKIEPNKIEPIYIQSNSIQPDSIQPINLQHINESSRENSPSIQESEPEAQSSAINTTVLPSIEQRCVEIDNRLIAIMERNSERDKLLVEATQTMAEGLKTMGQGLKAMGEGFKAMGEGLKALAESINRSQRDP